MCAVGGCNSVHSEIDASQMMAETLFYLQHRGDGGTGISAMTSRDRFDGKSDFGPVLQVYTPDVLQRIAGQTAVGHNLWPTDTEEPVIQPIWSHQTRYAFVHNGQLSETSEIRLFLERSNIPTAKLNDSQLAAFAIDQLIRSGRDLPNAVEEVYPMLNGGFACVAMQGNTMVAFRDPHGMRPLELAQIEGGHLIASETRPFRPRVAEYLGEVAGGEMVVMEKGGIERYQLAPYTPRQDPFEAIYIANRNSQKFGKSVDHLRRRLGTQLAEQFPFNDPEKHYLVTPVPETSIPIAETYAQKLGLEYKSAIDRDRYIPGRSFMQRTAEGQRQLVTDKISVVPGSVKGRNVIVIEDSFVRLTTAPEVYQMLIDEGAESVIFLSASPPIGYPDHAGVDTRKQSVLPASELSVEGIRQLVGCNKLGYLALSRLIAALDQPAEALNLSCFNGDYPYDLGKHGVNIKEAASLAYLEDAYAEAS